MPETGTRARLVPWSAMTLLSCVIVLYALLVLLLPNFGPPFIAQRRAAMPLAVMAHLAGGATALFVGAFQLNPRIRARFLNVHRWMGRTYVIAVAIAGPAALALAARSQEGVVTHIGFGMLAILWMATTARAYVAIKQGDRTTHRRWMIRSYALTFAAVTLRIILPAELYAGVPFHDAYQVVAWACWVPNLIVAEWWILAPHHREATA